MNPYFLQSNRTILPSQRRKLCSRSSLIEGKFGSCALCVATTKLRHSPKPNTPPPVLLSPFPPTYQNPRNPKQAIKFISLALDEHRANMKSWRGWGASFGLISSLWLTKSFPKTIPLHSNRYIHSTVCFLFPLSIYHHVRWLLSLCSSSKNRKL